MESVIGVAQGAIGRRLRPALQNHHQYLADLAYKWYLQD